MNNKSTLFQTAGYLLMIVAICSQFSCISYKHLTYLKDSKKDDNLRGYPPKILPYHIRVNDNLFVSLLSTDPDINKLYNPAQAGTSQTTANQYEGVANQFVYGYEVDTGGNLNLPILGKINVLGKTIAECEKKIEDTAKFYLKEVTAKVKLLNNRVTVLGEVKTPGVYYKYGYNFSAFEAISMANGTTDYAELDSVLVLRATKNGSETFVLNLRSKSALESKGYFLQPDDVVFVEPGKHKDLELHLPLYTIILSAASTLVLFLNVILLSRP